MSTLVLIAMLLAAPVVEIDLAPDQPLPFIYVDDPLIVEIKSDRDAKAAVSIRVQASHLDRVHDSSFTELPLRVPGSHWLAIKELPPVRGFYTAALKVEIDDAVIEKTAVFSRIDRRAGAVTPPVFAYNLGNGEHAVIALNAVAVNTLRFDGGHPESAQRVAEARAAGFDIVIALDAGALDAPAEVAAHLAKTLCPGMRRWELDPRGDTAILTAMAGAIRDAGCKDPIALVAPDPATFARMLEHGAGGLLRRALLQGDTSPDAMNAMFRVAERAGYEAWQINALDTAPPPESSPGLWITRRIIENLAAGAGQTGCDSALLRQPGENDTLAYISGLAHRFNDFTYAGSLPMQNNGKAFLFRKGVQWLLVAWPGDNPGESAINVGNAADLRLTDPFNNPLSLPTPENGAINLPLDKLPLIYLSGNQGDLLGQVARHEAIRTVSTFQNDADFQQYLPAELIQLAAAIGQNPSGEGARDNFLALLQFLPVLEMQWHAGQIPKNTAVPAIATLARLARALCTIEQDSGDSFVQPLSDTLAKCSEYQSLYLTGSTGTSLAAERGDWLLNEVRRLMDEAEALSAAGAAIEGNAVASLAEWRARQLEFAAKAGPLSEVPPDQIVLPEEDPSAPDTPPDTETELKVDEEEEAAPTQVPADSTPDEITHTVARGENPSVIAAKYGVPVDDLLKWNGLTRQSRINIGDKLIIRRGAAAEAPAQTSQESEPRKVVHKVFRNENPYSISKKYGVELDDFFKWNNLKRNAVLRVGQEVVVYVPNN